MSQSNARALTSLCAVRTLALIAAMPVLAALAAPAGAAERSVPRSFVGADADSPLIDGPVDTPTQLGWMSAAGVESIRAPFDWRATQPYRTWAEVPPDQVSRYRDEDGIPTDWSWIDRIVVPAVARRMTVLPVPLTAPRWAAQEGPQVSPPPQDPNDYARFMTTLVRRYGPNGRFWAEHPELPRVPIRHWHIWNEVHFDEFWPKPWEAEYVAMLRAARKAIKAADPRARVILAGLANDSWNHLERIYDAGGRRYFDTVAIHPFTARVAGVVTIARRARAVMARHGDRKKPLMITELSWTSARGRTSRRFGNETTEPGQAKKLDQAYKLLARERKRLRLERVYWYTWLTADRDPEYPFDYAGVVRHVDGGTYERKPAYHALRRRALALEGCRKKSTTDASRCLR